MGKCIFVADDCDQRQSQFVCAIVANKSVEKDYNRKYFRIEWQIVYTSNEEFNTKRLKNSIRLLETQREKKLSNQIGEYQK